jgi:hypothetical protein
MLQCVGAKSYPWPPTMQELPLHRPQHNGQALQKTPQLRTPAADSCIEDDRTATICNTITKQTANKVEQPNHKADGKLHTANIGGVEVLPELRRWCLIFALPSTVNHVLTARNSRHQIFLWNQFSGPVPSGNRIDMAKCHHSAVHEFLVPYIIHDLSRKPSRAKLPTDLFGGCPLKARLEPATPPLQH